MERAVSQIVKISTGLIAIVSVGATFHVTACAPMSTAPHETVTVTHTVRDSGPTLSTPVAAAPSTSGRSPGVMSVDGTYRVGIDVEPGTYKSAPTYANNFPSVPGRDSDFSGSIDSQIAIDNSPGQTIITIATSDVAFKTLNCQPWEKVG